MASTFPLEGLHVLVVEDEALLAFEMVEDLQAFGADPRIRRRPASPDMTERGDLPLSYGNRSLFVVLLILVSTLILIVVVASW